MCFAAAASKAACVGAQVPLPGPYSECLADPTGHLERHVGIQWGTNTVTYPGSTILLPLQQRHTLGKSSCAVVLLHCLFKCVSAVLVAGCLLVVGTVHGGVTHQPLLAAACHSLQNAAPTS